MRFRLGMLTGFATGYYLGTKAGRQRYDQINRSLAKLRRSDAFESAADRARSALDDGIGKARSMVDHRDHGVGSVGGPAGNGHGRPVDPPLPGQPGYSSSR